MNRPSTLVLVRHAESLRNKVKKGHIYFQDDEMRRTVKGIPDHKIPLTQEGMTQAERTGKALEKKFGPFDYVYHSGYLRTIQTADRIVHAYDERTRGSMRVRLNQFIREREPGYAYDMTRREAKNAFPWLDEHWKTYGGYFARPPGGESLSDVSARVYLFLNMLFRDRAGKKIMVVTHGGTLRCFRSLLEHWDYEQAAAWEPGEEPENCGVTHYAYDPEGKHLVLQEYNSVYWRPQSH